MTSTSTSTPHLINRLVVPTTKKVSVTAPLKLPLVSTSTFDLEAPKKNEDSDNSTELKRKLAINRDTVEQNLIALLDASKAEHSNTLQQAMKLGNAGLTVRYAPLDLPKEAALVLRERASLLAELPDSSSYATEREVCLAIASELENTHTGIISEGLVIAMIVNDFASAMELVETTKELNRTAKYLKENYGIKIDETKIAEELGLLGIEPIRIEFDDFIGEAIRIKIRDENGEFIDGSSVIRLTNDCIQQLKEYDKDGKVIPEEFKKDNLIRKYICEGNANNMYHTHGSELDLIKKSKKAIFITEGSMKAIRLNEAYGDRVHVLGLNGITSYIRNGRLIPEFAKMNLKGRMIYLVPDGDLQTNNDVKKPTLKLAAELKAKGAEVRLIELPSVLQGKDQNGIDDFLNYHGVNDRSELEKLINDTNQTKIVDDICLIAEGIIPKPRSCDDTIIDANTIKAQIIEQINDPEKSIQKIDELFLVISKIQEQFPSEEIATLRAELQRIKIENDDQGQRIKATQEFLFRNSESNLNKIAELLAGKANETLDALPRDKGFGLFRQKLKFFGFTDLSLESPEVKTVLRDMEISSIKLEDFEMKIAEIDSALKLVQNKDNRANLVELKEEIQYRKILIERETLAVEQRKPEHNVIEFVEYYAKKHEELNGEKLKIEDKRKILQTLINLQDVDEADTQSFEGLIHNFFGKHQYSQLSGEAKLKIKLRVQNHLGRAINEDELQVYIGKVMYRMELANIIKEIMNTIGTVGLLEHMIKTGAGKSTPQEGNPIKLEGSFSEIIAASNYNNAGHSLETIGEHKVIKVKGKTIKAEVDIIHKGTIQSDETEIRARFFTEVKSSFNALLRDYRNEHTGQLEIPEFEQLDRLILVAMYENARPVININTKGALITDSAGKAMALKMLDSGVNTRKNVEDTLKLIEHYENKYGIRLIVINEKGIDIRPLIEEIAGSKA